MPTKSKAPAPVSAEQTTSEAFGTILRHNFGYLTLWEEAARSWDDIEGVHQMRVTIRRMRSALALFQNAVPREASEPIGSEMRWIAGELGLARDLDVFISEGLAAVAPKLPLEGAEKLSALAQERRARTYEEQVRAMLDSERYRQFKEQVAAWQQSRAWEQAELTNKQAKRLSMNIMPYARKLLDKQERRVLAAGSHVDRDDAAAMHQLRIECKKLRYAAEFFRPLFPGMETFISHMKGLQDLLGTMNDVAVTRHLLDELLTDRTDQDVSVYAGGLIGWRTCELCHMLVRFDGYWEELVEATNPWWKKATPESSEQSGS